MNFIETSTCKTPKDWKVAKLKNIIEFRNGNRPVFSEKGEYKVYGANGVMGMSNKFLIDKNFALIIGRVGASGEIHLATGKFWVSDNAIYSMNYDLRKIEMTFLYYLLKFKNLKKLATRSTHPILTQTQINNLKIPLPPLPEQEKIAEILGTVDEAIQKVDEAIEKTVRLKKGLMHELLTKGIGHKEFKDTEIGRIPKEWEVVRLGEIVNKVQNGFASGKRDEEGIVQIRMNNIATDGRLILDKYIRVPFPANVEEWLLKPGDFLFNNTNSIDLVGKSTIFKTISFPCTYSNHFTLIKIKSDIALPNFVLYNFILLWQKGFFKSIAVRYVGQAEVRRNFLVNIKLPLPPLSEQERIEDILTYIDEKLELVRKRKKRYKKIKKGLMNDLLTGKRRVKV
ncbi:restriction endonuclease subunit S [candidate division WOR-3 bacterium]|nr:restriction endonuclease subunit S [candidate division WOR-3 bacterium]